MSKSVSWEESESLDYITIAKAGGRKDLLSHHGFVRAVDDHSKPYESVDWFAHPTPPPQAADHNYESALSKSWMQWSCPPLLPKLPEKPRPAHHRARSDPVKLPQLHAPASGEVVDLSRILSLDYQREWLAERERKQAEQQRRAKLKRAAQRRKLREHTTKARKIAGVDSKEQEKGRFIMKRFAHVPAKLKLPPL